MIPSIKQCENWLTRRYGVVINTNISGCAWFGFVKGKERQTGFPDKFVESLHTFVEIKRGNEPFKPGQVEWIKRVKGYVYRFWDDHVDVYDKDLILVQVIKYDETN